MKTYNIGGIKIESIMPEACFRVKQFMQGVDITCACTNCKATNAGLTQEQIKTRMRAAHE